MASDTVLGVIFLLVVLYLLFNKVNKGSESSKNIWTGVAFVTVALGIGFIWTTNYTGIVFMVGIFFIGYGIFQKVKSKRDN